MHNKVIQQAIKNNKDIEIGYNKEQDASLRNWFNTPDTGEVFRKGAKRSPGISSYKKSKNYIKNSPSKISS
jgi:hypothetical protein